MSERPRGRAAAGHSPGPLEQVYDSQVQPLMQRIAEICQAAGIDYVLFFALDDAGSRYLTAESACVIREGLDDVKIAAMLLQGRARVGGVIEVEEPEKPPQGRA